VTTTALAPSEWIDRDLRQERRAQRAERMLVEQPGAALGDHHGVQDHRCSGDQVERARHRLDRLCGSEHADLDRVDADVLRDRADLLDDRLGRQRVDRCHRPRVLRRHGRDRRHPVHAAAGEGLQVGLDARTAA
jgi:hypothetical protein